MKPSSATQATTPLCTGLLLMGLAVVYLRSQSLSFVWESEQLLIRETGLLAFGFFSASFLCTPMNRLAKRSGHRITVLEPGAVL